MKREIKFRAVVIDDEGQAYLRYGVWPTSVWPTSERHLFVQDGGFWMMADRIEQFTGLKDKNGKEIYEGDIIKWCFVNTGDLDEKEYTEVVEWSECGFFLDGGAPLTVAMDDCEVIGNIYENPELIDFNITE